MYEGGKVVGVKVRDTGFSPGQNFSRRLVETALAEGWMSMGGGKLTLRASPEDLVYTVLRVPGVYCDLCGEKLDAGGPTAQLHVSSKHPGEPRSDAWPSGYAQINAYECVLGEVQHKKYRALPMGEKREGDYNG